MKLKLFFNCIIPLVFGTLIYLIFRVSSLNIFSWINLLNIDFSNCYLRNIALFKIKIFPEWFLFSLPDGLWVFSYVNLMLLIWDFKIDIRSLIWILFIPFIAIISELGQKLEIIRGTFDIADLLFYILGLTLPLIITFKNLKIKYYEKN